VNTSDWPTLGEVINPSTSSSKKASTSTSKNNSETSSLNGDDGISGNDQQSKENKNSHGNVDSRLVFKT
jgi:hypothetical protein